MKRRIFLQAATAITVLPTVACAVNDGKLQRTRRDVEGPFYPEVPIPLNANLLLDDNFQGDELEFTGRILDTDGNARAGALIEIWQCDGNSIYRHSAAPVTAALDKSFRGFGAAVADANGEFSFQTIVPVPYPGRPPHIHVKVFDSPDKGDKLLTTQVYLQGFGGPSALKMEPIKQATQYIAQFDFVV